MAWLRNGLFALGIATLVSGITVPFKRDALAPADYQVKRSYPIAVPVIKLAPSKTKRACTRWYYINSADQYACVRALAAGNITMATFVSLNPAVNADCTNLQIESAYCIAGDSLVPTNSASISSSTSALKTPTLEPAVRATGAVESKSISEPWQIISSAIAAVTHIIPRGDSEACTRSADPSANPQCLWYDGIEVEFSARGVETGTGDLDKKDAEPEPVPQLAVIPRDDSEACTRSADPSANPQCLWYDGIEVEFSARGVETGTGDLDKKDAAPAPVPQPACDKRSEDGGCFYLDGQPGKRDAEPIAEPACDKRSEDGGCFYLDGQPGKRDAEPIAEPACDKRSEDGGCFYLDGQPGKRDAVPIAEPACDKRSEDGGCFYLDGQP